MCEFKVTLDGEQIMEDVIYVKKEKDKVILRDIIGNEKHVQNAEIVEISVLNTMLVLATR